MRRRVFWRRNLHGDRGRRRTAGGCRGPGDAANSIHEVRLTATDRVGNSETKLFTYTVRTREIVYASTNTGSGDIYLLP